MKEVTFHGPGHCWNYFSVPGSVLNKCDFNYSKLTKAYFSARSGYACFQTDWNIFWIFLPENNVEDPLLVRGTANNQCVGPGIRKDHHNY
jgi:hypothetical protein